MKTISAIETSQEFANVLNEAASGAVITLMSHNRSIVVIGPANSDKNSRMLARQQLFARLRSKQPQEIPEWTRDELYEG